MRRPLPILLVTLIGLGGLMSLSSGVVFGQVDDRVLPVTDRAVIASNVIRDRFSAREGSPVDIIIKGASSDEITAYTIALSKEPHIVRVQSTAGIAQKGALDDGYAPAFADYAAGSYQHVVAIHDIDSRSTAGLDRRLRRDLHRLTARYRKEPTQGGRLDHRLDPGLAVLVHRFDFAANQGGVLECGFAGCNPGLLELGLHRWAPQVADR
jgi:uncharacterized membrane protein YdfJ with MMPL/SSD domain